MRTENKKELVVLYTSTVVYIDLINRNSVSVFWKITFPISIFYGYCFIFCSQFLLYFLFFYLVAYYYSSIHYMYQNQSPECPQKMIAKGFKYAPGHWKINASHLKITVKTWFSSHALRCFFSVFCCHNVIYSCSQNTCLRLVILL